MERGLGTNQLPMAQAQLKAAYVKHMADSLAAGEYTDEIATEAKSRHYQVSSDQIDDMRLFDDGIAADNVINAFDERRALITRKVGKDAADQYEKASIEYSAIYERQAKTDLQKIFNDFRGAFVCLQETGQDLSFDEGVLKEMFDASVQNIFGVLNRSQLQESETVKIDSIVLDFFKGHEDILDLVSEYLEDEKFGIGLYTRSKLKESVSDLINESDL